MAECFQGNEMIPKLLDELKIRLISADELLNEAERKQLGDRNVKSWLQELKDVVFEADHIIDKINTEALRRKFESVEVSFGREAEVELEEILASLKLLLEQSNRLDLKDGFKRNSLGEAFMSLSTPLVEEANLYGRDEEMKSLIELLLSDDDESESKRISVIPIVGLSGIGKTTLARAIYNDGRVKRHFGLRAWQHVSKEYDVEKLVEEVFYSMDLDFNDPDHIQSELEEELSGKKFLFVQHDVWDDKNYGAWDRLRSCFESGARGSKIIVTTRDDIVASHLGNVSAYRLERISDDSCWDLFAKKVFSGDDFRESSDLKRIGVEIVKKCRGHPLAVKSMAGLLRSMMIPEAWREVLESEIWKLEFQEAKSGDILPALWLSYSFLPPDLKRCFAYLSVFPKGYEIYEKDRGKIISMWIAEGLLQPRNEERVEDLGEEYLNSLISLSFLDRKVTRDERALVMHDLIHDLAMFVSSETSIKTRRFSYRETSDEDLIKLENLSEIKSLRTLVALPNSYYFEDSRSAELVLSKVLSRGEGLRVLSLSSSSIEELPSSIGSAKHLRYLDLSYTSISDLPSSICTLYNLQTLLLSGCYKLERLPNDTCRLTKLRHLDINGTKINEMPPKMREMRDLQTLSFYVVSGNEGLTIKELGALRHLGGSFQITSLQNVAIVEDALRANMKDKKFNKLYLHWGSVNPDVDKEMEVLNVLEPHSGLRQIDFAGFGGTKFPIWVARESFNDMVKVSLTRCRNCRFLPPFGQLPSLKQLDIWGLDGVTTIGSEFFGTTSKPFRSLENLNLQNMPSWEKWSLFGIEQQSVAEVFPLLETLKIDNCKKLITGLPNCRLSAVKCIQISSCSAMVSVFPVGIGLFYRSLESVKITHCDNLLVGLASSDPFPSLKTLDIVSCETMSSVFSKNEDHCSAHIDDLYPSLESIELRNCRNLESFSETKLMPSSLEKLEIHHCPRLVSNRLDWGLQRLSSLRFLSLYFDRDCRSFPEEELLPEGLKSLFVSDYEALKGLNGEGFRNLTSLDRLSLFNCKELEKLPEELPSSLRRLCVRYCPLVEERYRRGTGQDWPKIQHIPDIYMD